MDAVVAKLGLAFMLYTLTSFGVDNRRIPVADAPSKDALPSGTSTSSPSTEASLSHNSTAPSVAASGCPDGLLFDDCMIAIRRWLVVVAVFLVGSTIAFVLVLFFASVFVWRLRKNSPITRHERSMHQGIILAYNNKFTEGGLSELKLTTEDGCVNNGFSKNEARKTEQHGDTPIVARKLGLAKGKESHVNDSSGKKDLKTGVVIRKHDASDINQLPPPKPKRSAHVTSGSDTSSTKLLSTSAPHVGFTQLSPFDGGATLDASAENIYDVPRDWSQPRRASNPEMGRVHVYDTPDCSGTGRHVSDPLPQVGRGDRPLSYISPLNSPENYDNSDENIYDVPSNCDNVEGANTQFDVDDIYDVPTETEDFYSVPMNVRAVPNDTSHTTVGSTVASPNIDSTLTIQRNETTNVTGEDIYIVPLNSTKPLIPPKPPRRRSKMLRQENVYAVPRNVSPVINRSKKVFA